MAYRVTAPYVMVRVPDIGSGKLVYYGFYADAVLPEGTYREDLDRHVRKGMVVKDEPPAEPEPELAEPVKPAKATKAAG